MIWQKIRSSVMFVVSFLTCPCHLPITLPLAVVLLGGTSVAIWITQHVGWIYGGMTLLFMLSLALGFHWMSQTFAAECDPKLPNTVKKTTIQIAPKGVKHEEEHPGQIV